MTTFRRADLTVTTSSGTTITIAVDPISIPLSSQDAHQREINELLLLVVTGHTVEQIKRLADVRRLRLRRHGKGTGARYVLYLRDWEEFLESLPGD